MRFEYKNGKLVRVEDEEEKSSTSSNGYTGRFRYEDGKLVRNEANASPTSAWKIRENGERTVTKRETGTEKADTRRVQQTESETVRETARMRYVSGRGMVAQDETVEEPVKKVYRYVSGVGMVEEGESGAQQTLKGQKSYNVGQLESGMTRENYDAALRESYAQRLDEEESTPVQTDGKPFWVEGIGRVNAGKAKEALLGGEQVRYAGADSWGDDAGTQELIDVLEALNEKSKAEKQAADEREAAKARENANPYTRRGLVYSVSQKKNYAGDYEADIEKAKEAQYFRNGNEMASRLEAETELNDQSAAYQQPKVLLNVPFAFRGQQIAQDAARGAVDGVSAAMNDTERRTILSLAAQERWEDVEAYYGSIERRLNQRAQEVQTQAVQEAPKAAQATIGIAGGLAAPGAYLQQMGSKVREHLTGEYRPVDLNAGATGTLRLSQEAQRASLEDLPAWGQTLGNVGYSVAQNVLALPLGPTGAAIWLGASAAGSTSTEALEEGASLSQALTRGAASAVIETATEKMGLDNLFSAVKKNGVRGARAILREIAVQAGTEGAEEAISEYANTIFELIQMGEDSQFYERIDELKSSGMSAEQAGRQATYEFFVKNPAFAALSGALSGVLFGAGGSAANAVTSRSYGKSLVDSGTAQILIDAALRGDAQSEAYSLASGLQKRMESGRKVAYAEYADLARALGNEGVAQAMRDARQEAGETAAAAPEAEQAGMAAAEVATGAQGTDAGARYSIGRTTENQPFVEVEQDILAGVEPENWVRTVKQNLKEKFPDGVTVGNNEIRIDGTSRREMTYSRYMQWLRNNAPQTYADKLRATDNADEVLLAATEWINEGLKHDRSDDIQDFARGKTLLRVGSNDYEASVIVGTTKTGTMRLYDIIDLVPTSFEKREGLAAKRANPSPGASRSTASLSESSIAQETESVNGTAGEKQAYTLSDEEFARGMEQAREIGHALGVKVEVWEKPVRGANGCYADGVIRISRAAVSPLHEVFVHELTHHIEKTPAMSNLGQYVISTLRERGVDVDAEIMALRREWAEAGVKLEQEEANREYIARFCQKYLFRSEAEVRRLAENRRNLVEIIRRWLHRMRVAFQGTEEERIVLQVQQKWERALDERRQGIEREMRQEDTRETQEDAEEVEAGNAQTDAAAETVSYSVEGESFQEDKYFARQLDKWDELTAGTRVKVGMVKPGSALNRVGLPESSMFFDVGKIRKAMEKHGDHLTPAVLKGIPDLLDDPIVITEYKGPDGNIKNTVNVYGNLFVNDTPVVIGVVMRLDSNGRSIISNVRSVHARRDFARQITDDTVLYLNEDKKRTRKWFHDCGNLNVPLAGTRFGLIRSIAYENDTVKTADAAKEQYSIGTTDDWAGLSGGQKRYPGNEDPTKSGDYIRMMGDGEFATAQEEPERIKAIAKKLKAAGWWEKAGNSKDISRVLDAVSGTDTQVRQTLREHIEDPLRDAKRVYVTTVKRIRREFARVSSANGIRKHSKASAAVMWIAEGQRIKKPVDADTSKVGRLLRRKADGEKFEMEPYTLQMLKDEFSWSSPENGKPMWENILECERWLRQAYDDYVDRINAVLTEIYPDVETKAKEDLEALEALLRTYRDMQRPDWESKHVREKHERADRLQAQMDEFLADPERYNRELRDIRQRMNSVGGGSTQMQRDRAEAELGDAKLRYEEFRADPKVHEGLRRRAEQLEKARAEYEAMEDKSTPQAQQMQSTIRRMTENFENMRRSEEDNLLLEVERLEGEQQRIQAWDEQAAGNRSRVNQVYFDALQKSYNEILQRQTDTMQERVLRAREDYEAALRTEQETRERNTEKSADKIRKVEAEAGQMRRDIQSGEIYRNRRLTKRRDYMHHFAEIEESISDIFSLGTGSAQIDPALIGISEYTQPNTKWAGFMQRRRGGKYQEDAVAGFLRYMTAAEYKINIEPLIPKYRAIIKTLAESTQESRNANQFIGWLINFTNDLAGKTNPIDRTLHLLFGDEQGRKILKIMEKLNGRLRANAVTLNVGSALMQFTALPNVMAYVKNPLVFAHGVVDAWRYVVSRDAEMKRLRGLSVFLDERFLDQDLVQFAAGFGDKGSRWKAFGERGVGRLSDFMLSFGDSVVATVGWFSLYESAKKQGKGEAEAADWADDRLRRAVGGRGIGEIPLAQKSKLLNLMAPFQLEVQNTWNELLELGKGKDYAGLLAYFTTTAMLNLLLGFIGRSAGVDLFGAVADIVQMWTAGAGGEGEDEEEEKESAWDKLGGSLSRLLGEVAGNMPLANAILPMLIPSEDDREAIFGEQDPTRYGTGNMGLNTILRPIIDLIWTGDDLDLVKPAVNYLLPMGGKFAEKAVRGLQGLGWLPDINLSSERGVRYRRENAVYTDSDGLRFEIDRTLPNILAALFLSVYDTTQGKQYTENGAKAYSPQQTVLAHMAQDACGIDLTTAAEAQRALGKIKGDEKQTAKQKKRAYIDALDLTKTQKEILWKLFVEPEGTKKEVSEAYVAWQKGGDAALKAYAKSVDKEEADQVKLYQFMKGMLEGSDDK